MQERRNSDERAEELRRRFEQERLQALEVKRARDDEEARLKRLRGSGPEKTKGCGRMPSGFLLDKTVRRLPVCRRQSFCY